MELELMMPDDSLLMDAESADAGARQLPERAAARSA